MMTEEDSMEVAKKSHLNLIENGGKKLFEVFLSKENAEDDPFELGLKSFEQLELSAKSEEELMSFFLEDVVFSSLHATFYESILIAIKQNPEFAEKLINDFSKDIEARERIIAIQTHHHMEYVIARGYCKGCRFCDNHKDVDELVEPWIKQEYNFFCGLYVGMKTIQFGMEQLLYEHIPTNPLLIAHLGIQNILDLRQAIFAYAEKKFFNLLNL